MVFFLKHNYVIEIISNIFLYATHLNLTFKVNYNNLIYVIIIMFIKNIKI